MGIPRLTQDVAPYGETVTLGHNVTKVVIDGPSMVYHVYNALLHTSSSNYAAPNIDLPSYIEINRSLDCFLTDISSTGVTIQQILFDGALPIPKRPTRSERLEKSRQNLEQYFKLYSGGENQYQLTTSTSRTSFDINDIRNALWDSCATVSPQQRLLPPPQFMVANAIEHLHSSKWASITHTVCGEADAFCASEAARLGAAVLTNDSDLLMYGLGDDGSVISLRSLERSTQVDGVRKDSIRGSYLRPKAVASQLNVPSMLVFGYQRSLDSYSSTKVIAQRARTDVQSEGSNHWLEFRNEYRCANVSSLDHFPGVECLHCAIADVDPRTAELIYSLRNGETLQIYLPIILENIARDACWSYGCSIRRLAYSMLLHYCRKSCDWEGRGYITEFVRKGQRIAGSQVIAFSYRDMLKTLNNYQDNVAYYLNGHRLGATSKNSSNPMSRVLPYHLLAADLVVAERIQKSKSYEPSLSRIFARNRLSYLKDNALSWDDVHLYASMQSVLYSLRMFKQIITYIDRQNQPLEKDELWCAAQSMLRYMSWMPSIAELFPSIIAFREMIHECPVGTIVEDIHHLFLRVGSTDVSHTAPIEKKLDSLQHLPLHREEEVEPYTEGKSPGRQRKRVRSQTTRVGYGEGPGVYLRRQDQVHASNPFALLGSD